MQRLHRFHKSFNAKFDHYCGFRFPAWIPLCLWMVTLSVLTYFTLDSLIPMLSDYFNQNVATVVNVVSDDQPFFKLPNLTICIPYHSASMTTVDMHFYNASGGNASASFDRDLDGCLECEWLRNRSWDVWTVPNFDKQSPPLTTWKIGAGLIRKLVKEDSIEFNSLNAEDSNCNWNQPLVDAVQMLLHCVFAQDRRFPTPLEEDISEEECVSSFFPSAGYLSNRALRNMYDLMFEASHVFIKLSYPGHYWFDSIDAPMQMLYYHTLCFALPLVNNTVPAERIYKFEASYYNRSGCGAEPPWKRMGREVRYAIYHDLQALDSFGALPTPLFSTEEMELPALFKPSIDLQYSVDTIVLEGREDETCSSESVLTCEAKSKIEAVQRLCGCFPFAYRYIGVDTVHLPYCNYSMYNVCREQWNLVNTTDRITETCKKRCENVFYSWDKVNTANSRLAKEQYGFEFTLSRKVAPHVAIMITKKNSRREFLAAVGGTINLYLGCSGLTVCALVIFLIGLVKHHKRRNRRDQANAVLSGWRTFWLTSVLTMPAKNQENAASSNDGNSNSDKDGDSQKDKDDEEGTSDSANDSGQIERMLREHELSMMDKIETLQMKWEKRILEQMEKLMAPLTGKIEEIQKNLTEIERWKAETETKEQKNGKRDETVMRL